MIVSYYRNNNSMKRKVLIVTFFMVCLNSGFTTLNLNFLTDFDTDYIAYGFDYPVGKPNAKGYYNAQEYGQNSHLGEDWNAVTGGNSDLGHPIYAIANGYVSYSSDLGGGWGNVNKVIHQLPNGKQIESMYAHCQDRLVSVGSYVTKGRKIATIGNANGTYLAHLHFELREKVGMEIGDGYSEITEGYLNPTKFIKGHRVIK